MVDFAVKVDGLDSEDENKARWVLAIDPVGERLLVSHEDQSLHWHAMAECKVVRVHSADQPQVVLPVKPQEPAILTPTPMPNRAERRRGNGA